MVKLLVGILVFALLCVVGYYRFSAEPLTARQTLESGLKQVKEKTTLNPEQEMVLKVQLAISDYMAANGTAPAALTELVPKYFDSEPKNPVTGEAFPYTREGKSPRLGAQVTQVAVAIHPKTDEKADPALHSDAGFVNPNTMVADDFVYE